MDTAMVGGGDGLDMDPVVKMNDLDDHLIQLVLSKMTITEQLAVTRVCHRFNDSAFKLTIKMYPHELPFKFRIDVLKRLPKLKVVAFYYHEHDEESEQRLLTFLESLAINKPNIERLIGPNHKLHFFQMVRKHHPDNNLSNFKYPVHENVYEDVMKMVPGVKLKYKIFILGCDDEVQSTRRMDERLLDPNLVVLGMAYPNPLYGLQAIVSMARNVTDLNILQTGLITSKPDYAKIFDTVSTLKLKIFVLDIFEDISRVPSKVYGWTPRDVKSFKALLELPTLMDITLRIPIGRPTYDQAMKCFLQCPKNNFRNFAISDFVPNITDNESGTQFSSFSPFYIRRQSPYYASILLVFKKPGHGVYFPWSQFIQKFHSKYREFQILDPENMKIVVKSLKGFIEKNPKIHFVITYDNSSQLMIFKPNQFDSNGEPYFEFGQSFNSMAESQPQFYRS